MRRLKGGKEENIHLHVPQREAAGRERSRSRRTRQGQERNGAGERGGHAREEAEDVLRPRQGVVHGWAGARTGNRRRRRLVVVDVLVDGAVGCLVLSRL